MVRGELGGDRIRVSPIRRLTDSPGQLRVAFTAWSVQLKTRLQLSDLPQPFVTWFQLTMFWSA